MSTSVTLYPRDYYANGDYQKIHWLGVAGFIIINEPDKEILLVDPWPSYRCDINVATAGIERLTRWLQAHHAKGYTLSGIVVTHEHFDHFGDVPIIFIELFAKGIPAQELPPIYCDQGTFDVLKSKFGSVYHAYFNPHRAPVPDVVCFEGKHHEIALNGTSLYYDDVTQQELLDHHIQPGCYPLVAGTKLSPLPIGAYEVTPYIWDHASTFLHSDSLSGNRSGNFQRATALFLRRPGDPENKRLFLVGSAGEMSAARTGGYCTSVKVETDVLIQAMPHELLLVSSHYKTKLAELVKYQTQNITAKEAVIACHFENFVRMKSIDNDRGELELTYNKNRVVRYAEKFEAALIPQNTVYYLNRFIIDYDIA
jgi:hypothetical protein